MRRFLFLPTLSFVLLGSVSLLFTGPVSGKEVEIQLRIQGIECDLEAIYDGRDPATVIIPPYCNNAPQPSEPVQPTQTPPDIADYTIRQTTKNSPINVYTPFELPQTIPAPTAINTADQAPGDIYASKDDQSSTIMLLQNLLFFFILLVLLVIIIDVLYYRKRIIKKLTTLLLRKKA